MAEQMRPASPAQAPDPSLNYERSRPENEAGLGKLDTNRNATPAAQPDGIEQAVTHKQEPRQLNAHEVVNDRAGRTPGGASPQQSASGPGSTQPLPGQKADHSMKDEQPLGWDQAPADATNPRDKRHPRAEGRGGTP